MSRSLGFVGALVVVASMSEEHLKTAEGLGLVLVVDRDEVLVGERLGAGYARSSWTRSPLLDLIAEHHLRPELHLPRVLDTLGERAGKIIHPGDWDLFTQTFESTIWIRFRSLDNQIQGGSMAKKNMLFRAEEWKSRQSTAALLRELADNLDEGEITLRRGEEEVRFALPETVELEIEVTEKVKKHKTERELEIEIEWTEEQVEGTVTVG